jgi:hypothetical protein
LRGAKGNGWYYKYIKEGNNGFKKFVPPTPFDWDQKGDVKRPIATMSVSLDDKVIGDLKFELASDVVPKTVSNFISLCKDSDRFSYVGTKVHRNVKGVSMLAGDVEGGNGRLSHSADPRNRYFSDENFIIPHSCRGLLRLFCTFTCDFPVYTVFSALI